MELLEARQNDILVLALKGRLGATSAPSVLDYLQKRIDEGERQLAVDATALTYISSCGLRLLLQVAKRLEQCSGQIVLCALQEPVKRVLRIAGFMSLFNIFSSSEEAIHYCQRD